MERSISEKIQKIKQKMGDSLTILAHHYQRDEIVQHADFVGDSLELARKISSLNARYIIMCGVYFMAESSAILAKEDQKVFIPVAEAGCTLADLAPGEMVEIVLQRLNQEKKIIPIAYVNTSAKVKAICAKFAQSEEEILLQSDSLCHENVKEVAPTCEMGISVGKLCTDNAQCTRLVPS